MTIWDSGTYETEKWREDEVIVRLSGERVQGPRHVGTKGRRERRTRGRADRKARRIGMISSHLRVAVGLLPLREHAGLASGEIGLHREIGLRQVDRVLVIDAHYSWLQSSPSCGDSMCVIDALASNANATSFGYRGSPGPALRRGSAGLR